MAKVDVLKLLRGIFITLVTLFFLVTPIFNVVNSIDVYRVTLQQENLTTVLRGNFLNAVEGSPVPEYPLSKWAAVCCNFAVYFFIGLIIVWLTLRVVIPKVCCKNCTKLDDSIANVAFVIGLFAVFLQPLAYVIFVESIGPEIGLTWKDVRPQIFVFIANDSIFIGLYIWATVALIMKPLYKDHVPFFGRDEITFIKYKKKHILHKKYAVGPSIILKQLPYDPARHTTEVTDSIKKLIQHLWEAEKVGIGRDAKNLNHKQIEVRKIIYIGQQRVFESYAERKLKIAIYAQSRGGKLYSLSDYGTETQGVATYQVECQQLESQIDKDLNECYLFHGTSAKNIKSISRNGFRLPDKGRMLGKGIYFSDSPVKADQYADRRKQGVIVLSRVLLGNAVVTKNASQIDPQILGRPWVCCKLCLVRPTIKIDSVVYDGGLFRECVVFESCLAYPEFAIYYNRV